MRESEFWDSTPYITRLYCQAVSDRDRNRYRHDLFTAFKAAWYARKPRLGGGDLNSDLRKLDATGRSVRRQSPEEIMRVVETLNLRFGGADLRNNKLDH
jgi:hypothetical protein